MNDIYFLIGIFFLFIAVLFALLAVLLAQKTVSNDNTNKLASMMQRIFMSFFLFDAFLLLFSEVTSGISLFSAFSMIFSSIFQPINGV